MQTSSTPILSACNDFLDTSGGAIFHTGSLRLSSTSFVGNKVGVEGPAIMSVGFLEELSDVSFLENTYDCRAGQYGYIYKNEVNTPIGTKEKMLLPAIVRAANNVSTIICVNCLLVENGTTTVDQFDV